MAATSHRCFHVPPLKYRVQYGQTRHRCRFRYPESNTLGGKLLCQPILYKIYSWSYQIRRCRFAEWDAINVFLPNTPALVLSRLYRHRTNSYASLIKSSSAALTTIRVFFIFPIVLTLYQISAHIRRVSAHRRPTSICSPCTNVSFVPVISLPTIACTVRFGRTGTTSPFSAMPFYLLSICANSIFLLSVATSRGFCLRSDRLSVPLVWDTISESPQLPRYVPRPIVWIDLHHRLSVIPLYLPLFAVLLYPLPYIVALHIHPYPTVPTHPPLYPSSQNIFRPTSPSSFLSSRARLHLSVFYHHFHPCKTLLFSLLLQYLSSYPYRPPPSYIRHPSISASLRFTPHPKYVFPTTLHTSSLSI